LAWNPAQASLDVARVKPGAERVRWTHGHGTTLRGIAVDLANRRASFSVTDGDGVGEAALLQRRYVIADVRDAPDRPGREFVFIARRPT
jgi:hypothetical protein